MKRKLFLEMSKIYSGLGQADNLESEFFIRMFSASAFLAIIHLMEQPIDSAMQQSPSLGFFVANAFVPILFILFLAALQARSDEYFQVLRDLQDISIYSIVLQAILFCAYHKILPVTLLDNAWAYNSTLVGWCIVRLFWPVNDAQKAGQINWPAFGVLGFFAWLKQDEAPSAGASVKLRLCVYTSLLLCYPIGLIAQSMRFQLQDIGFAIAIIGMILIKAVPFWNRKNRNETQLREDISHLQESHQENLKERDELAQQLAQIRQIQSEQCHHNGMMPLCEFDQELLESKKKIPAKHAEDFMDLVRKMVRQFTPEKTRADVIAFPKKTRKPEKAHEHETE